MTSRTRGPGSRRLGFSGENEGSKGRARTGSVGSDGQAGDGVDHAEDEMCACKATDVDHGLAETVLDDAVAHADDK